MSSLKNLLMREIIVFSDVVDNEIIP